MTVHNKEGASLEVTLRFAKSEGDDVSRLIALMKKQHGNSYMPSFYQERWVRHGMETGEFGFVLAELADGTLAGIIGADTGCVFTGALVLILLVVDKPLRGFGMGKILHHFILNAKPRDTYTCIYGHCMSLDPVSQRNHIEFGYKMTGLMPNWYQFDPGAEFIAGMKLPLKHSLIIAILPKAKRDAGLLYVPEAYIPYISEKYDSLGAAYTFAEPKGSPFPQLTYTLTQSDLHRYCEIFVTEGGAAFAPVLKDTLGKYASLERQSFTVFVSMNDPGCPAVCALLEEQGFFFTGIHPLSGQTEYLIYHYSPTIPVPFDKIAVVKEFKKDLEWIKSLYGKEKYVQAN
ncbi:hypothetical protein AGMMS49942_08860 [Spirochaetia bacterium]|nr:hypothetical protein AGMMS49942_08860 [Spirochaetia bacterium]